MYDLTKEEDWKEFDKSSNPGHVYGVAKWLAENANDNAAIVHNPICDECGEEINLYYDEETVLCGYAGCGGIAIQANHKFCTNCDESLTYTQQIFPDILCDLEKENPEMFAECTEEEVKQIFWNIVCEINFETYDTGDDRYAEKEEYDRFKQYILDHLSSGKNIKELLH